MWGTFVNSLWRKDVHQYGFDSTLCWQNQKYVEDLRNSFIFFLFHVLSNSKHKQFKWMTHMLTSGFPELGVYQPRTGIVQWRFRQHPWLHLVPRTVQGLLCHSDQWGYPQSARQLRTESQATVALSFCFLEKSHTSTSSLGLNVVFKTFPKAKECFWA